MDKEDRNENISDQLSDKYSDYYDDEGHYSSISMPVYNACREMADFKDAQPISELGGWHTEPPTKDCKVLLYMTKYSMTVATWSNPNNKFYDNEYYPIKVWTKWKEI